MTLTVLPSAELYRVELRGAADLTAAALTLRLPEHCTYRGLGAGTLLERSGTPLALAGPRGDGAVHAASALPRGLAAASGDGTLLTLRVEGTGCGERAVVLDATAYAADGTNAPIPLVPELPGSGVAALPLALCIAAVAISEYFRRFRGGNPPWCRTPSPHLP